MKYSIFLFSIFYFLLSLAAQAASLPTLYFEGPATDVRPGAEFDVTLFLDAPEAVNAYSIRFGYPRDLLELTRVNDSRSIVTIWRDQPNASSGGAMNLTGGSLKPFRGERGEVLTFTFKALRNGSLALRTGDSSLYLANGKGTRVEPVSRGLTLRVRDSAPPFGSIAVTDTKPPIINQLALTADPFHDNRQFVGFVVEDKETGVRATFVRIRRFLLWGEWEEAQNPTAIPRGAWAVELRAVDNAENVSEAVIYNWSSLRSVALLGALAVAALVINTLIKRRRGYNKGNA